MLQTTAPVLTFPWLLATDGSPSAQLAQEWVRRLFPAFQAADSEDERPPLAVVNVQPRSRRRSLRPSEESSAESVVQPGSPSRFPRLRLPSATDGATAMATNMAEVSASLTQDFPTVAELAVTVRQGRPTTEILNQARSIQAGLIVLGHRGIHSTHDVLLGGVSSAVARYAPCSVLVARGPKDAPAHDENPSLHGLLVVDGSRAAQRAIAATQQLALAGLQRVTILHVEPPIHSNALISPFAASTPNWHLSQSLHTAQQEHEAEIVAAAKASLHAPQLEVNTLIQTGDPGPSICQVAQNLAVDLVLLGSDSTPKVLPTPLQAVRLVRRNSASSDRLALRNTRLSVTEDYVIHYAPCSVLLCRGIS
jgi:nucleotide-binding universal stress UspA family protein